ncbi:hypothetical protein [Peterkaempfera griseoplana]|uniref:hypothetical protein n=1 Tax=Peterkaempfera griseoplana TaxID=66896 RepID=UPI0006E1C9D4|nr:hypothetical protein [Peterkaempfera griseoplana]
MTITDRTAPPPATTLRARRPLAVLVLGLAATGFAMWTWDHYVGALVDACQAGPGIPAFGPVAAVAGLLLGLTAVGWLCHQLFVAPRRGAALTPGVRRAALVVVALSVVALLVQAVEVKETLGSRGYQPDTCSGAHAPSRLP